MYRQRTIWSNRNKTVSLIWKFDVEPFSCGGDIGKCQMKCHWVKSTNGKCVIESMVCLVGLWLLIQNIEQIKGNANRARTSWNELNSLMEQWIQLTSKNTQTHIHISESTWWCWRKLFALHIELFAMHLDDDCLTKRIINWREKCIKKTCNCQ